MAALTITAASVVAVAGATVEKNFNAGASITAGQLVYLDSSNTWQLCDSNVAGKTSIRGVALNGGASGQPLNVQTAGSVTIGATVVVGTTYCLSDTPGGIDTDAAVTSGMTKSIFGVATTAAIIAINIFNSGAAVP